MCHVASADDADHASAVFVRVVSEGNLAIGDRIIVSSGLGSRPGILKYVGDTHFAVGTWCGIQLDEPSGKNDGSVDGQR